MKAYKYYPSAESRMAKAYADPNSKLNQANRANARAFNKVKFWFFVVWTLFFAAMFTAGRFFPQWYDTSGLACLAQFLGMGGGVFGLAKVLQAIFPVATEED